MLNCPSHEQEIRVLSYVFTGKLTLFPVVIIFLGFGAGYLLFYGNKSYTGGYFQSNELYYGIAGLIVSLVALLLFFTLSMWMVLRVSFVVTPTTFRVLKSGILRSSNLEFDVRRCSLHYFRTHYNEDRSWLQLCVKEGSQYYQIFSWKGKGKQKERFLELFKTLRREIRSIQGNKYRHDTSSHVIVSRAEFTLIGPFTARYKQLVQSEKSADVVSPLCIEVNSCFCVVSLIFQDIPSFSYDSFFNHFAHNKRLPETDLQYLA